MWAKLAQEKKSLAVDPSSWQFLLSLQSSPGSVCYVTSLKHTLGQRNPFPCCFAQTPSIVCRCLDATCQNSARRVWVFVKSRTENINICAAVILPTIWDDRNSHLCFICPSKGPVMFVNRQEISTTDRDTRQLGSLKSLQWKLRANISQGISHSHLMLNYVAS